MAMFQNPCILLYENSWYGWMFVTPKINENDTVGFDPSLYFPKFPRLTRVKLAQTVAT
jgi:hypothetical protein